MTIDKYFKLDAENKKKQELLQVEINNLVQREGELAAAEAAAAERGDVDAYILKKAEREKVSSTLFVKRSYLNKLPKATTDDDALDAWNGYAEDYNNKMRKALADFGEQKNKLCKMYSELVSIQQSALSMRDRIAATSGMDKDTFKMMFIPVRSGVEEKGLLTLGGFLSKDTDACYYLANYSQRTGKSLMQLSGVRDSEEERITTIVLMHKSL